MGVLGFAPFLQKRFPEVIRELPERLRSLSGKTIAIDGTLITQRLHFAPMPCENRHILGWYRLMRELKESGVGVICVFDGEERSHAKQRETQRRKQLRMMDVARGGMEIERSRRLRRLTTLLKQYRSLPESVKRHATKTLQNVVLAREQREVHEPLQALRFNTDAEISHTAKQALTLQLPFIPGTKGTASTIPSPDDDTPEFQKHLDQTVQIETPSSLDTPKSQSIESGLWTLKDVLPEYFVTADATPTSNANKPPLKEKTKNAVSSKDDNQTQTSHEPKISLTNNVYSHEAIAEEPDDSKDEVSQLTEVHVAPPRGVADVFNDTAQSSSDERLTSPDASLLVSDIQDRSPIDLSLPAKKIEYPQTPLGTSGDISLPSTSGFKDPLELNEESRFVHQEDGSTSSDLDVSLPDAKIVGAESPLETISQGLLSLYQEYQESIPTFMSPPTIDPPAEAFIMSEEVSVQEQYVMSRNQVQLTLDEGNLWDSLVRPSIPLENSETTLTEEKLESLAHKSDIISRSYEKRNNPPTLKTYEECKLILRAMGVPCIETIGPYEAEALAASLVHHGLADYVASEDTDVLVYEAPLLRNLANRQSPLTLLSGAEVREVLQLDRASYVDFALLLGTDFSQRIKNLGPHRAIKLIRTHGRIEHVMANEPKFIPRVPPDAYLKQVEIARLVFETLPPVPDPETLRPTDCDDEAVVAILEKFGVYREASVDWDFASALDGNYFGDNPAIA